MAEKKVQRIEACDLHHHYEGLYEEGKTVALDGINLTIEAGEFVAVLGHNGSGKSTFAKHLNAILLPTGGKVYINGMDTADEERLFDIRKNVGMVFQNPDNQMVATVVEEDVAFALENMGIPTAEIRERVDGALRAVEMYEYRKQAPHLLSGGQKQRVAIAGVIAMMPETVVMDEPTAMLDPIGRQEVMDVIELLSKTYGITVILITHHMDEAARAGRVIVMDQGKILLDGSPREIFTNVEVLAQAGLEVPQTVAVLHELKNQGADIAQDAMNVDECAAILQKYLEA